MMNMETNLITAKQITWTSNGRSYTVKRLARGNGQLFVTDDAGQIHLIDELGSFDNFVRNYLVNAAGVAGVEVI